MSRDVSSLLTLRVKEWILRVFSSSVVIHVTAHNQSLSPAGFDFNSCPEWSACGDHPVFSLWRHASQKVSLRIPTLIIPVCEPLWLQLSVRRDGMWQHHCSAQWVYCWRLQQEEVRRNERCRRLGSDFHSSSFFVSFPACLEVLNSTV